MPDSAAAPVHCPVCGAVLAAGEAEGLCVACLLGEAMETTPSTGGLGRIAGHELIEIIARGGMGIVYRARQGDPPREVALKALPGAELMSAEARQRFKIEAEAMARLEHPAILPIYELGEEDGTPFFTMKLARGGSLAARLETYRGKWRDIAELIAQVAEAAHYAHERGVLHRDLKPGNILFDGRPDSSERLRPGKARGRAERPDAHDHVDGHAELHGTGADTRRERRGDDRVRCVEPGCDAVRAAGRPAAISWR
jgi:serine/threonine-protein kinase